MLEQITRGKTMRPPRIVLLGTEKAGKSTFASQSDSPVFLPIKGEEGIDALDVPRFPTITAYQDLIKCLESLKGDHKHKTVVIDSVTTLEQIVFDEVCRLEGVKSIERVGGGYGKGYTEAINLWRNILYRLDELREHKKMASILIGHTVVKTHHDPVVGDYDRYTFDINQKASSMIIRWADSVLFASRKVAVSNRESGFGQTTGKGVDSGRKLYTSGIPGYPCDGRGVFGHLPKEIDLSWASFVDAIKNANGKE